MRQSKQIFFLYLVLGINKISGQLLHERILKIIGYMNDFKTEKKVFLVNFDVLFSWFPFYRIDAEEHILKTTRFMSK